MTMKTSVSHWHQKIIQPLDREQRLELIERIENDIEGYLDFSVLMILSAILASLGLLQGSTAVVIGAMLVAPLMIPLVAAGLGIAQGNFHLFKEAMVRGLLGIFLGLAVSLTFGFLNPGFEPSMEVEARGTPDILDLVIALVSGMLGGYASVRPKVIGSLAGVAIAAALLPPLAVVGIGITNDRLGVAMNASILLSTNLVAIVMGAAIVFRLFGLNFSMAHGDAPKWVGKVVGSLLAITMVLMVPLIYQMRSAQVEGQARPLTYPVSAQVRDAVNAHMEGIQDIEIIMIGRQSVEPESGITVLVATKTEVPDEFELELREVINQARGKETHVRIFTLLEVENG